jgi:hypothetical protein
MQGQQNLRHGNRRYGCIDIRNSDIAEGIQHEEGTDLRDKLLANVGGALAQLRAIR